jgi:mercuric ion binding protein
MKTIFLSFLVVAFVAVNINASVAGGKKEKVTIQTSAQCDQCVSRLTKALKAVDGVKTVTFNEAKQVDITFDNVKTNADALRNVINQTGYDADATVANADVYSKLPQCCQKGGHE